MKWGTGNADLEITTPTHQPRKPAPETISREHLYSAFRSIVLFPHYPVKVVLILFVLSKSSEKSNDLLGVTVRGSGSVVAPNRGPFIPNSCSVQSLGDKGPPRAVPTPLIYLQQALESCKDLRRQRGHLPRVT